LDAFWNTLIRGRSTLIPTSRGLNKRGLSLLKDCVQQKRAAKMCTWFHWFDRDVHCSLFLCFDYCILVCATFFMQLQNSSRVPTTHCGFQLCLVCLLLCLPSSHLEVQLPGDSFLLRDVFACEKAAKRSLRLFVDERLQCFTESQFAWHWLTRRWLWPCFVFSILFWINPN
jgi:hypothetical protein